MEEPWWSELRRESLRAEEAAGWSLDANCEHCPKLEPSSEYGSGGPRDSRATRVGTAQAGAESICLHAMAYSCESEEASWSFVCPVSLLPSWASKALGRRAAEVWSELDAQRSGRTAAG